MKRICIEMEWKDIDYWMLMLNRYYWLQEKQMECNVYFKSYMRLGRILNKMDDEWFSRDETAYEDIWW